MKIDDFPDHVGLPEEKGYMDGIRWWIGKNMAGIVIDFVEKNGCVSEEKYDQLLSDPSWKNGRCAAGWRVFLDTKGGPQHFTSGHGMPMVRVCIYICIYP